MEEGSCIVTKVVNVFIQNLLFIKKNLESFMCRNGGGGTRFMKLKL